MGKCFNFLYKYKRPYIVGICCCHCKHRPVEFVLLGDGCAVLSGGEDRGVDVAHHAHCHVGCGALAGHQRVVADHAELEEKMDSTAD